MPTTDDTTGNVTEVDAGAAIRRLYQYPRVAPGSRGRYARWFRAMRRKP